MEERGNISVAGFRWPSGFVWLRRDPVSGVCVVASLSPLWGLFSFHFLPTACAPSAGSGQAVGCILTPLRGSTPRRLSLPAIVRREGGTYFLLVTNGLSGFYTLSIRDITAREHKSGRLPARSLF